jgi:hypothetical protein
MLKHIIKALLWLVVGLSSTSYALTIIPYFTEGPVPANQGYEFDPFFNTRMLTKQEQNGFKEAIRNWERIIKDDITVHIEVYSAIDFNFDGSPEFFSYGRAFGGGSGFPGYLRRSLLILASDCSQ